MNPGTIIVFNGTTSSGKSTLISLTQDTIDAPCLNCGIDKFLYMLPDRYLKTELWAQVLGKGSEAGPVGQRLFSGMHQSIAALSRAGNFVLADHVLLDEAWVRECATLFADLPAYLVGVRCPLGIVEMRERARKDRTAGQARRQFELVHKFTEYDLDLDTHEMSIEKCVLAIKAMVDTAPPRAFKSLAQRYATSASR